LLSYVVFDPAGIDPRHYPPRHALLIGADEIPMQGTVTLRPGVVEAEKGQPQAAALLVQLPVSLDGALTITGSGSLGLLAVQTCLLPERAEPYLLSIELARHRIMLFLNKLEDWGLFDLPAETACMQMFEAARQKFNAALVAQRDAGPGESLTNGFCPRADRLATNAMALAIHAGEQLTMLHAERQMRHRVSGQAYKQAHAHLARLTTEAPPAGAPVLIPGSGGVVVSGNPQLGCAVSPGQFSEPQQRAIQASCDFVTMPLRWIDMEPVEGKYGFAATDRWIEWAVRTAKVPIVGGPLIDFRPRSTPDWLFIWENDYETLRELVFEHVQAVVTRYRRTISRWTVCGGLNVNTNFKISFDQIMDLTRVCVLLVRKLQPTAKVQVEVSQPWGEYHAFNRRSIPPYLYAEAVAQAGLNIDALGLRVKMGHAEPGLATRDLMSLSAMLDRYAGLERPIAVTALGAPSAPVTPGPYRPRAGADAEDAYEPGYWREPWSEGTQADWLTQVLAICCGKPYVQSVCWQELSDPPPSVAPAEMPSGGLLMPNGHPKAAFERFAHFRNALQAGQSPVVMRPG
jgi:hypothetical protein